MYHIILATLCIIILFIFTKKKEYINIDFEQKLLNMKADLRVLEAEYNNINKKIAHRDELIADINNIEIERNQLIRKILILESV